MVGVALGIALIFDAVTDPLAGSLSDNWHSRLGRRHPFMYASAIPLGITFFFLFNPPAGLSETWLFVWVLVLSVLTRTAMTLYHVPHIALGAEMTENYQERTLLVSFRQFFGTFGGIFAVYIGFQYFFAATPEYENGGQFNPDAYAPYAIFLAVLMVITIWWCWCRPPTPPASEDPGAAIRPGPSPTPTAWQAQAKAVPVWPMPRTRSPSSGKLWAAAV